MEKEEYPTPTEQFAFSCAHDLIHEHVSAGNMSAKEFGDGLITAALVAYRKTLSEEQIASLLYRLADDYATRQLRDE